MFKIGEFSKLTRVSIRMLRYYDENGLLIPAQTDPHTNYRLYTAEQIKTLNRIVFLRDLGFSVAEISDALARWHSEDIDALLEGKRRQIEQEILTEQEKLKKLRQAQQDISRETLAIHCNVTVRSIPAYQVLSLRRVVPDYYAEGVLWAEMEAYVKANHIPIAQESFAIYHDPEVREADVDIEICAVVSCKSEDSGGFVYRRIEPVPHMACMMVYGPFQNIAGGFLSFAGWLQEHAQYEMCGQDRQIVHRGPWNEEDPEQYLTEIQIPLRVRG